ncbi:MAG: MFS transporter [Acidobacteria bacterium]|nr:MFS transporter [Acidobacteriota bacterium]
MNPGELERHGRRTVAILFAAQSLYSAGYVIVFTISSILAVQMGGSPAWTGVPITVILSGAALGAWPIGRYMGRRGRRLGLSIGQLCGFFGSLVAGAGILTRNLGLFLAGLFFLGISRGTLDMGRYAAADANPAHRRATAMSLVVLGGTVGAFLGPPLLKAITGFELASGLRAMSMPWFVMAFVLLVSFLLVFGFLRPDPLELARIHAAAEGGGGGYPPGSRDLKAILRDRRFFLAVLSIVSGHLVMYLLMTVTPVFMNSCHHAVTAISWVIVFHMFGMYGLSYFVGRLIDKVGRPPMIVAGCLLLAVSCLLAPLGKDAPWLGLVLFLVGLGWNACFVGGSTLLSDILHPAERGRTQGLVDTLINLAAGAGSLGSGFLFAALGFNVLVWISLLVSLLPCLAIWAFTSRGDVRAPVLPDT